MTENIQTLKRKAVIFAAMAAIIPLTSCSLHINADGSKDVSVDGTSIARAAIIILTEK